MRMLVALLVLAPMASSNPLRAVRKAVDEVGGLVAGDSPSVPDGPTLAAAGGTSGTRPGPKQHDGYPPGISFSSLLNNINFHANTGKLMLNHIQATFLSMDASGYIILRRAGGGEVYRWDWDVDQFRDISPYYLLGLKTITDLRTGEVVHGAQLDMTEPGDYVLDFYLPDEHFYSFPFGISKVSGDDPFASRDRWFIDGDWERWGYFHYDGADPEKPLAWKVWLRNKSAGRDRDIKPKVELRHAGGDLVCVGRDTTQTLKPAWNRFEYGLIFPPEKTSGGAYFKAKDLLNRDGDYTLTLLFDDGPYAVWKFTIEGGKFKPAGRTVRGQANPLTFIEGGLDAFWYCAD